MKNKKTITIWSDFACPFCYIGERRLKNALEELGISNDVTIEYRAFELDPNAPLRAEGNTIDRMASKYGISKDDAKKRVDEIDSLAKDLGIDMQFGKTKSSNTFTAHRLMKFAETNYEPAVVEALNELLFDAYFCKHEMLSDEKLLLRLAERAGMDATQSNEVIRSRDLFASDVRYDEEEAKARGIRGVPFIVFDGIFAVPGAISTEDFKKALLEMMENKKDPIAGIKPKSCNETGCSVD